MWDDTPDVDESIQLRPLDEDWGREKPRRRVGMYLLVGGAVLLSLATMAAFVLRVASALRERDVTVAAQQSPMAGLEESVRVFSAFDAFEERQAQRTPEAAAEREALMALLHEIESAAAAEDTEAFRQLIDFSRLGKRIELADRSGGWTNTERRYLRTSLRESVDLESTWAKLQLVRVVTPTDDVNTRIVYAFGWDANGGDQSEHRLWLGRDGESWKLYDWQRLDLGMAESQRWGTYYTYNNSPLLEAHNRWVECMNESDELSAAGDSDAAKEQLRIAVKEVVPRELADHLWMLTGHRWLILGETDEAERCYLQVSRPNFSPGTFLGLLNIKRSSDPAAALRYSQLYESAVGPGPDLAGRQAQLLLQLGRKEESLRAWEKKLRIEPDNTDALTQLFTLLPKDEKAKFYELLGRCEQPAVAVEEVAEGISWSDYPGLLQLAEFLQRTEPGAAGTLHIAGLAKEMNVETEEAARFYRQAYDAATDGEKRESRGIAYTRMMAKNGQAVEACDAMDDPKTAVQMLMFDYDDGAVWLSKDEYRELVMYYRQRFPDDRSGILWETELAIGDKRYADAERLARLALAAKGPTPQESASGGEDEIDYEQRSAQLYLAVAMYRQGRLEEAYDKVGKPEDRFSHLANLAIADNLWNDIARLLALHEVRHPDDAQLHLVRSRQAAHEKNWDKAIEHARAGVQAAEESDGYLFRSQLHDVYLASGKWKEHLASEPNADEVFNPLAQRFAREERWDDLAELIALHRRRSPDDADVKKYLAEIAWARDAWDDYIAIAEPLHLTNDDDVLSWYERYTLEERLFSAFVRTRNFTRARQIAEQGESNREARLAIVSAASGNLVEARRHFRAMADDEADSSILYSDKDVGRIFLSPEFRVLQRDSPVEISTRTTQTVAVFLFDEPWKVEGTDVTRALAANGFRENTSLETPPGSTWSYSLNFGDATFWIAGGEGAYDEKWRGKADGTPLAETLQRSQGWLAIGTAGLHGAERRRLAKIARQLATHLVGDRDAVLCIPVYEYADGDFNAYLVEPELMDAWQTAGRLDDYETRGESLADEDESQDTDAQRQFERSLREAVRRFESTPGSRLTVFMNLPRKRPIDLLELEVTSVVRRYGSFDFRGQLARDLRLFSELKAGLPMTIDTDQVWGWRLDGEEAVYRPD